MNELSQLSIAIADESELLREAWAKTLTEAHVYGASTKDTLHKILQEQKPDIVLYDLYFTSEHFELTVAEIVQISPSTKVVVLSFDTNPVLANHYFSCGAKGFFNKYIKDLAGFVDLLQKIKNGETICENSKAA